MLCLRSLPPFLLLLLIALRERLGFSLVEIAPPATALSAVEEIIGSSIMLISNLSV
jgi:hypothetical protein